jgi:hypothetical protein
LSALLAVDPLTQRVEWELNGSILAAFDRVLSELDVQARARQREDQRQRALLATTAADKAVSRMRRLSRRLGTALRSW